jgi:hypothetical protein
MKTSETHARQSHLSNTATDSGGKEETSRGWILLAALRFAGAGFRPETFFRKTCFTTFGGFAADLARRVVERFDGLVVRCAMGDTQLQV